MAKRPTMQDAPISAVAAVAGTRDTEMSERKETRGSHPFRATVSTVLPHAELRDDSVVVVDREADRFETVSPLGEGSVGRVELVRDNDIERFVAVKQLKSADEPQHVLRFVREARCLGQLEHPGIVPVHDVGRSDDGSYYIVMKHLEGQSLDTLILKLRAGDPDSHERFPIYERLRICEAVLRVMEYAHARGIVHRDLKPGNIMVGEHGEVTVVDWGLAKNVDEDTGSAAAFAENGDEGDPFGTRSDTLLGTPLYMSPEQTQSDAEAVGRSSDVYSMAVVFYELLTLEHYLADAEDLATVMAGVRERDAQLAYWVTSPHQPRVPIEIAYWLQIAMKKNPRDRFHSAEEMRRELQRAAGGQFDVVCPTTFSRRAFRLGMDSANRRPVLSLLAVLGFVALAGYGAWRMFTDFSG